MGVNQNSHVNSSRSSSPKSTMGKEARRIKERRGNKAASDGGGHESEHGIHTWTERERRKKMRNMFSTLHALLPQLPAKADKSTIVDEAVRHIKSLERTLQTLQKKKLGKLQSTPLTTSITEYDNGTSREAFLADHFHQARPSILSNYLALPMPASPSPACFQTWLSPNVVISICGDDAQISICWRRKPGLLTSMFYILEKHRLDVLSVHISSDQYQCMYMFHVHAAGACDNFPEALSVEDTFKLAAGEMNLWLLSC